MIGLVIEQVKALDHHARYTVGQICRVGGYECWARDSSCWNNIVCRKYSETCFSLKSCVNTCCRQIKYLLPVRRKSNRLTGKVRSVDPPQCRPKINRKQKLRFPTSCCMQFFHFPEMYASLIDKQHISRETGICSTLLKI